MTFIALKPGPFSRMNCMDFYSANSMNPSFLLICSFDLILNAGDLIFLDLKSPQPLEEVQRQLAMFEEKSTGFGCGTLVSSRNGVLWHSPSLRSR